MRNALLFLVSLSCLAAPAPALAVSSLECSRSIAKVEATVSCMSLQGDTKQCVQNFNDAFVSGKPVVSHGLDPNTIKFENQAVPVPDGALSPQLKYQAASTATFAAVDQGIIATGALLKLLKVSRVLKIMGAMYFLTNVAWVATEAAIWAGPEGYERFVCRQKDLAEMGFDSWCRDGVLRPGMKEILAAPPAEREKILARGCPTGNEESCRTREGICTVFSRLAKEVETSYAVPVKCGSKPNEIIVAGEPYKIVGNELVSEKDLADIFPEYRRLIVGPDGSKIKRTRGLVQPSFRYQQWERERPDPKRRGAPQRFIITERPRGDYAKPVNDDDELLWMLRPKILSVATKDCKIKIDYGPSPPQEAADAKPAPKTRDR